MVLNAKDFSSYHQCSHLLTAVQRKYLEENMCARDTTNDSNNEYKDHGQPQLSSSSSTSSDESGTVDSAPLPKPGSSLALPMWNKAETFSAKAKFTIYGVVVGVVISAFSLVFPLMVFREAATKTYLPAAYQYVDEISYFDNTFLTYGTDYMIAAAMVAIVASFPKLGHRDAVVSWRSKALLASYASSVFFGGLCHQFYTSCAMRQTWHFRLLWTLCVGFVTVAPGCMGAIATELVRQDESLGLAFLPAVPAWFWTGYGATATLATILGHFSFQRPACDIFVAGVTQFPSTFYLMAMLALGLPTLSLNRWTRYRGLVGFIMMSVTLPSYPLAVQYTNLSLGTVNCLLHIWLLTAWTTQGLTLRSICQALQQAEGPPVPCVPVKRKVA